MSADDVTRGELPVPDYDHLPVGSLGHRVRSLPVADLETLLAYERTHAHRLPVLQVLEARMSELADGAELSSGSADGYAPEAAPAPSGDGPVSPDTQGPVHNRPPHGNPMNLGKTSGP